jgi:hypothetical protein
MSDLILTFILFKNFGLLNSRVGAGAASKFSPRAGHSASEGIFLEEEKCDG